MDEWYYKRAGSEHGPVNAQELRTLLDQDKGTEDVQVRRSTSEQWAPAEVALPVVQASPATPPPLPPPLPKPTQVKKPTASPHAGPTGWLWVSAMLFALDLIVICFMDFVFSLYALSLLAGVTGLPDWFTQCVNALDSKVQWTQATMFVLLILWQGCAFGSLLRLYADDRLEHGRSSGFWWITPMANLFMPFQCLRELRWATQKRRTAPESGISAGVVIWMIQAVIILKVLAAVAEQIVTIANAANAEGAEESPSTVETVVNLASNFFGLAMAGLLVVFVLRNLIQQIRLYRAWNTPEAAL